MRSSICVAQKHIGILFASIGVHNNEKMPHFISRVIYLIVLLLHLYFDANALAAKSDSAQVHRNEVTLSVGHWATDMLTVGWGGQHRTVSVSNYSGAYNMSFRRQWGSTRWMGLGVGFEQVRGKLLKNYITGRTAYVSDTIGQYRLSVYTFVPEVVFIFDHDTDRNSYLYALVAAGVSVTSRIDNFYAETSNYPVPATALAPAHTTSWTSVHFNGQVSPICFKVGAKRLSGFLELGFGYKGIVCGGLVWKC
jgi:hypothetical protein